MIRVLLVEDVLVRHPKARIYAFRARLGASPPDVPSGSEVRARLEELGIELRAVADHPHIHAWRQAAAAAGLKPSTFRSSPEQLVRRYLKGDGVSTSLPVVDFYCAISASHLVPLGAYDVARLPTAEVEVRIVNTSDTFRPLGGGVPRLDVPAVVYASGSEVICYGWNHRDSATTCLVPETHDALFFGEALDHIQRLALDDAFAELREGLIKSGAAVGDIRHVDRPSPSVELPAL